MSPTLNPTLDNTCARDMDLSPPLQQYTSTLVSFSLSWKCSSSIFPRFLATKDAPSFLARNGDSCLYMVPTLARSSLSSTGAETLPGT